MKEEAGQSCVVTVMIRIYALKSFRAFFYMETKDREYMNRARILADRGRGWVNPNPLVGAVIVKDGRIIGEGWHERYGGRMLNGMLLSSVPKIRQGLRSM